MKGNIRILAITLAVGIALMAIKFVAWWWTGSNAILSDALESIVNIGAGAFALFSVYLSSQPKDDNHPYGHGKVEFISAGLEGSLILLAGISIIGKSVYNLFVPQQLDHLQEGLLLVLVTGGINYLMGLLLEKNGKRTRSPAVISSGKHLQTDAYTSAGLLIGLVAVWVTGWNVLDNIVAIIFGALILYTGYRLARKSIAGIMDEADPGLINHLVRFLEKNRRERWIDLHNFRVIQYGGNVHIDCHLSLPWYLDTKTAHDEINSLEQLVDKEFSGQVEIFVHIDPCLPFQCRLCDMDHCPERIHPFEKKVPWSLANVIRNKRHSIRPGE